MLWHYTASHMVSLSLAMGLSFSRHAKQKECFIFLLRSRGWNEGYAKVCEDFKIIEEAPARALSWLKAPTIAFTFRTLIVVVGLLCNCDIFAKLRLTFVSSSTTETDIYQYLWGLNIHWGSEFACFCTNPTFIMWANFHNLYKKWKCLQ